jgi:hypothetical protein
MLPALHSSAILPLTNTAYSGERPYLAVINADGSEQRRLGDASLIRRLTGTAAAEEEPAWSPDGEDIDLHTLCMYE